MSNLIHGVEQAVVLAGGEGTRLRPLTNNRPKPLLPVLGRPCIEYSLRALASAGIGKVHLACAYRSQEVVNILGTGRNLGIRIEYAFEDSPMGTAGAVKLLEPKLSQTFVVVMGDTLMDIDFEAVIRFHQESKAMVTVALTEVERPSEFGIVGLDDKGRIIRFKEKPAPAEAFSNLINAGVYVIQREAFKYVPQGTKFDFSKNLFPRLLELGHPMYGARLRGMWKDIGRPKDLLEANLQMIEKKGMEKYVFGVRTEGKMCTTSFSAKGATLRGPIFLGEDVGIGEGATVSSSAIGKHTIIEAGSLISGSLLLDSCVIMKGASISDCILGEGSRIGPGVTLRNCILADRKSVDGPANLSDQVLE